MKYLTRSALFSLLVPALLARPITADAGTIIAAPTKEVAPPEVAKRWAPGDPISFYDGKLVFDISYQGRYEYRENTFDFNSAIDTLNDDSWYLQRARIGIRVKPVNWLVIYAQGQDAREVDSDRTDIPGVLGAEGDDSFDLRQAYVEIGDTKVCPFSLKLGRQVLNYGDQRLIGAFEWNNIARTFDAAKLTYTSGKNFVDLFVSSVVNIDRDGFNPSAFTDADLDSYFTGLYASLDYLDFQTTDLYALWLDQQGGTSFVTLGTRWKSAKDKTGPWDYTAEAAFQLGEVRDLDLTAFAGTVTLGYTFDVAWKPRLSVGYSYGTGDSNATDGEIETFQNLYPTNHLYYGYMDTFSWQNISNPQVGIEVEPCTGLKLRVDYHMFWLADTGDAWYRANGVTQVRPITPSADSSAGSELDITATYKVTKYLSLLAGYSHFFAGDYLEDTGASSDADFAYLQVKLDL